MKRFASIIFFLIFSSLAFAQNTPARPKLVVGIVVDQMRQEYLYRFESKLGKGGFKRLMGEGFMLKNAHYNYVPTYTGPGHASIYTGSTPAIHGIISNDWYDKTTRKTVNCVGDERYKPVGNEKGNGDVSPSRMLSSTITDELELATQRRSKVIGISVKDRGAVLPAGHTPDGAYWFDSNSGKFITSTYYKEALPLWLEDFNKLNLADNYLNQEWKTVYPIDQYKESGPDDTPYETKWKGKDRPVFPYNLKEMRKLSPDYELLAITPFGNDLLAELAKTVIDAESLGKDEWTDFLAVSFSSTDLIGHAMGPNSIEVEDTYIRLDKNIEDLLNKLDKEIGKGQYLVFLTADHAVADVPQYLKDLRIPADNFRSAAIEAGLADILQEQFPGKKLIENVSNGQIFFNQELFAGDPKTAGVDYLIATELIKNYMLRQEGVYDVYTRQMLSASDYGEAGVKGLVKRGYHTKRSGDMAVVLEPGWFESSRPQGTTHGSPFTYDTSVPVLFYGYGIKPGSSVTYHTITDIAPTLSVLLKIKYPNGSTGQPVKEILD